MGRPPPGPTEDGDSTPEELGWSSEWESGELNRGEERRLKNEKDDPMDDYGPTGGS